MARIRTIKPEFFSSERIAQLSLGARLTFQGLWTEADDYGICEGNARVLKGRLWALDDHITAADVERFLGEMTESCPQPLIAFFEVDGKRWIQVLGWHHQKINRPSGKRNPSPPAQTRTRHEDSVRAHGGLSEDSVRAQCPELELELELEHVSSSSGPTQQEISTGHDDDEPMIDLTQPPPLPFDPPPPPDAPTTDHVARAVALELGRRDSHRSPSEVRVPAVHAEACARTRWAVQAAEIVALTAQHPQLLVPEIADLVEAQAVAMAAHPAGGHQPPGSTPPAPPRPACGTCGQPAHRYECPWEGWTAAEIAADIEAAHREAEERGDQ